MLIIIIQGGAKTELPRINSGAGTQWTGAPKVKLFVIGTKIISTMKLFVVRDRNFPHTRILIIITLVLITTQPEGCWVISLLFLRRI